MTFWDRRWRGWACNDSVWIKCCGECLELVWVGCIAIDVCGSWQRQWRMRRGRWRIWVHFRVVNCYHPVRAVTCRRPGAFPVHSVRLPAFCGVKWVIQCGDRIRSLVGVVVWGMIELTCTTGCHFLGRTVWGRRIRYTSILSGWWSETIWRNAVAGWYKAVSATILIDLSQIMRYTSTMPSRIEAFICV